MRRVGVALIAAVMVTVIAAGALEAKTVERKRTYGLREQGVGHIQMRSVIAPVKMAANARNVYNTPVTVVLTVRDNSRIGQICNKGPRISDALMQAWYQQPMTADYLYDLDARGDIKSDYRRTPAQQVEDRRFITIVNAALGTTDVSGILVIKGTISMGGGAVTKLPFSSVNGCDELQEDKSKKKH
jgi:hypothetical protein